MQVFIPFADFRESAKSLDNTRLNKQILEATQILDIIYNLPTKTGKPRTGFLSHPAVTMWKPYGSALQEYTSQCILEAESRDISVVNYIERMKIYPKHELVMPVWWGDEKIHSSHRARLLQKPFEEWIKRNFDWSKTNIEWYQLMDWEEKLDPDLMDKEYLWPTETEHGYELLVRVSKEGLKNKQKIKQALKEKQDAVETHYQCRDKSRLELRERLSACVGIV